jgi:hypothetical protein
VNCMIFYALLGLYRLEAAKRRSGTVQRQSTLHHLYTMFTVLCSTSSLPCSGMLSPKMGKPCSDHVNTSIGRAKNSIDNACRWASSSEHRGNAPWQAGEPAHFLHGGKRPPAATIEKPILAPTIAWVEDDTAIRSNSPGILRTRPPTDHLPSKPQNKRRVSTARASQVETPTRTTDWSDQFCF